MAEIIGLIASIGTIASAGFAVAKAISDLADELGSAGKNIKVISVDTKAVALILHEMKRRLDKSTRITQQTLDIACEIASLCKADLESIKQFLLPVLPAGGDKMSMVQKAKWIFVKAKVSAKRVSLNSLKLTITLFLHTLDFIEGDLLDEEYTKDEIKNIAEESKKTKSAFLAAERFDQTLERAYAATLSSNPSTGDENADLLIQLLHHHDQVEGDGTGVLKRLGGHEGDIDFSTNLLQTNQHSQPNSQQSNFQTEESLSDDQFLQIAWHIRTQKNVASYASVVLEKGYQEREITRSEHHREAEGQSNTSQNSSANQHQSVHLHSPQDLPDDDRVSRISDADEQISQRNKSESDSSPAHKAPSVSFSDLDVHCGSSPFKITFQHQ
ncbi:hypothetical protein F5B22DRAFT_43425 [Xylaria bambusicola]|uniref:uncharacterized protein n=1 Tax=Xylaria bambusicola TaxID=326684 RepID=UPI002007A78C|nr:uncharacterized protein F5B22DRAFT_43425 [Xylaria bambusicola]KAI0502849.1 hypothetical protein F5B22DRAFT_43425 [Xylaria bambusicola]